MTPEEYLALCDRTPGLLLYVAGRSGRAMIEACRLGLRMGGENDDDWSDDEIMEELSALMKQRKAEARQS